MLERFVESSLKNRLAISTLFLVTVVLGSRALLGLPVDAFPDTTPIQVQINTVAPALNPEEIERQITFPVETTISGLPGLVNVRSVSKFGFSQIVATFDDQTPIYDARQLVLERLRAVLADICKRVALYETSGSAINVVLDTDAIARTALGADDD